MLLHFIIHDEEFTTKIAIGVHAVLDAVVVSRFQQLLDLIGLRRDLTLQLISEFGVPIFNSWFLSGADACRARRIRGGVPVELPDLRAP